MTPPHWLATSRGNWPEPVSEVLTMSILRFASHKPNRQNRNSSLLYLESLEDRCVPSTVTNLTDHEPGSLRDMALALNQLNPHHDSAGYAGECQEGENKATAAQTGMLWFKN